MITFRQPTNILIAGPTQAGKTFFFKQILEDQLIQPSPSRVISVYGEHVPNLADLKHLSPTIEYVQGRNNFLDILPTIEADERNCPISCPRWQYLGGGKIRGDFQSFHYGVPPSKHNSGVYRSKCFW